MAVIGVPKPKKMFKHICGYCHEAYTNSKKDSKYCSFSCLLSAIHKKPKDQKYDTVKRTLAFIKLPKWLRIRGIPNYVLDRINAGAWPYKGSAYGHTPRYYLTRDKAMMALGFLACGRVNEILRVERSQFDRESEPNFIICTRFYVSKRKKATVEREGPTLVDIPMPTKKRALLYPFTQLVTDYLEILEGEKLFPIGEGRAWQIVNETGVWPHWFRALGLTYFANMIKSPYALARIYGIANVNTIMKYFRTEWQAYRDIYTLTSKVEGT